jgi:hypothetical protein
LLTATTVPEPGVLTLGVLVALAVIPFARCKTPAAA